MTREEIIESMKSKSHIYGTMYGGSYRSKNAVLIPISVKDLTPYDNGYCYVWGWPGPDYNDYTFDDYGKTWAFSIEEMINERINCDDSDCISREAAIHKIMGQPPEAHYPDWYAEQIKELPSVKPIDALEQEPCEDCISREVVKDYCIKYGLSETFDYIENLPSVKLKGE